MIAVENCLAFSLKMSLSALVKLAVVLYTAERPWWPQTFSWITMYEVYRALFSYVTHFHLFIASISFYLFTSLCMVSETDS